MDNHSSHAVKEPFLRLARKSGMPVSAAVCVRGAALLLSLLAGALFIFLISDPKSRVDFGTTVSTMWHGAFGTRSNRLYTFAEAAKLLCIGVALAPAFKMKFWNIGAEGQVLIGCLMTAVVMYYLGPTVPAPVLFPLMFVSSVLGGAIWALIPALFKAYFNTNETLFTLMMNYVAMCIVRSVRQAWSGTSEFGAINAGGQEGYLPKLFGQDYLINIMVFMVLAIVMFFYLRRTKQGYEIAVVGESQNTARYAGINVKGVILRTMAISGAICGLCGALVVSGASHTLTDQLAGGYGFTAIIVAWLSKFNTIIMVFVSLLLVFLERGTGELSSTFRIIPTASGKILVGLVLFFIIACEFFVEYRLVFRSGKERKETSSGGPVTRFFYRVDAFMVAVLHKIAGFFVRVGKAIIGCFAKKNKGGEQE